MAVDSLELYDSQEATHSRTGSQQERKFLVTGTEDTDAAAQFTADSLPGTVAGLYGATLSLQDFRIAHVGGGVHEISAKYSSQAAERSFDTGGGTTRITQSRRTLGTYVKAGEPVPNFHQAVNTTDDSVEGCDITVSQFSFTEKRYFPRAAVTPDFLETLSRLTGRTNDAAFRNWEAGEVLLQAVSGSERGTEDFEFTFKFAVSRDEYGVRVADLGLETLAKDNFGDTFEADQDVYKTPGGLAAPTAGSTDNRPLAVSHEASVPGDTDIGAGGDLTKLLPADVFTMGVSVYLDPDGKAVLTNGGGVNVFVGLAQSDSLAGDETVAIGLTLTKADPDQAFDQQTPLWIRADGEADNKSAFNANELIGRAYAASAAGAESLQIMTIFKPGWGYLWIRFLSGQSEGHFVKVPVACVVEQVYQSGDFAELGIGEGPL